VIAEALADVDALIAGLDKLIAKKRDVKTAVMQVLLTGEKRLPGFGNGRWETEKLGNICQFYSGGTPSTSIKEYYIGDIPWITSSDLNKKQIFSVEGKISKKGLESSSAKMVKPNTLLIALYGATAGEIAMTRIEAAINQAVLAVIPDNSRNAEFLFHKLRLMKEEIVATYTQGGQPNLSGAIIKSIEVSIPRLEEQTTIAAILSDMDAELTALETRHAKTQAIKQGMMQELLTGRTRLL
jgi:type I restriction enzyme S subunit